MDRQGTQNSGYNESQVNDKEEKKDESYNQQHGHGLSSSSLPVKDVEEGIELSHETAAAAAAVEGANVKGAKTSTAAAAVNITQEEEGDELTTLADDTASNNFSKRHHNRHLFRHHKSHNNKESTASSSTNHDNRLHLSPSREEEDTNNNNNHNNDEEEEERQALLHLLTRVPEEFQITLRLGLAAVEFGAISYKAEQFMVRLLKERFGYLATVWVTNGEVTLSIFSHPEQNIYGSGNLHHPVATPNDIENGGEYDVLAQQDGRCLPPSHNPLHAAHTTLLTGTLTAGIRATIHPSSKNNDTVQHDHPIIGEADDRQANGPQNDDDHGIIDNVNHGLANGNGIHNNPIPQTIAHTLPQRQPLLQPIVPPTASTVRLPWMVTLPFHAGADLQKLIDLSCICADLLHAVIDIDQANVALEQLHTTAPHWNSWQKAVAYLLTSAGFGAILRGNSTDLWASAMGGALTLTTIKAFERCFPDKMTTFAMWAAAFAPAVLATSISLTSLHCNVTIVVIGSIISEVPGFMITKGTAELVHNCILAGLGHWISAFLICVWLAFGGVCGYYGVLAVAGKDPDQHSSSGSGGTPINELWYILIAPVLAVCFSIFFAVGRSQLPQSIVVCLIGFGMSLTIDRFPDPNLGNVAAAFVTTLAAQIWARSWHHKLWYGMDHDEVPNPSSVVLLPAFFILVGGSIGVRAFVTLVSGDVDEGGSTLLQFLLVPFDLVLGMYLGMSLIPSTSVL